MEIHEIIVSLCAVLQLIFFVMFNVFTLIKK